MSAGWKSQERKDAKNKIRSKEKDNEVGWFGWVRVVGCVRSTMTLWKKWSGQN